MQYTYHMTWENLLQFANDERKRCLEGFRILLGLVHSFFNKKFSSLFKYST